VFATLNMDLVLDLQGWGELLLAGQARAEG